MATTLIPIYTVPVLSHAANHVTQVQVMGTPDDKGTGHWVHEIRCQECNGLGTPRTTENADDIYRRAHEHAAKCSDQYALRAQRCVDADRRGDRFDCPVPH